MVTVSVSIPDDLVEQLDMFAAEHDYRGRSDVIREAVRLLFEAVEEHDLEGSELIGLVTVLFNYDTTSVEERLMDLRHEHEDLVAANVHNHVGNSCLELLVLNGTLEEISGVVETIRAMKDPLSVSHTVVPLGDHPSANSDSP
jgi:CopG family nickel-responsive transcriptional regulator